MLTRPDVSDDTIIAMLRDAFALEAVRVTFLPINVNLQCAVFRLDGGDGAAYFLKLRRSRFDEVPPAVAAFLRGQGIEPVMGPLPARTGKVWARAYGFTWLLYPFFDGTTALRSPLTQSQWNALGRCMKAVHSAQLPAALEDSLPRERFSAGWRRTVRAFSRRISEGERDDPAIAGLVALWQSRGEEIGRIVDRAERLAEALLLQPLDRVLCHSDLHANNVLAGTRDELAVVDWDEPILAPRERDLMFVGGGVAGAWNQEEEVSWFYEGYGRTSINREALAYYRYERVVEDIAAYGERALGRQGSPADREEGLRRLASAFLPGNVVEMAHDAYARLDA